MCIYLYYQCASVYVYPYIVYMCAYILMYICICIMYMSIHIRMYVCMHVCMYVCVYACVGTAHSPAPYIFTGQKLTLNEHRKNSTILHSATCSQRGLTKASIVKISWNSSRVQYMPGFEPPFCMYIFTCVKSLRCGSRMTQIWGTRPRAMLSASHCFRNTTTGQNARTP